MSLDLLANRLDRGMGTQEPISQGFVFTEKSKQQVLGLDVWRAELAGFVPREEDYASCLFCVTLEHIAPVLLQRRKPYGPTLWKFLKRPSHRMPAILIIVGLHLFYHRFPLL